MWFCVCKGHAASAVAISAVPGGPCCACVLLMQHSGVAVFQRLREVSGIEQTARLMHTCLCNPEGLVIASVQQAGCDCCFLCSHVQRVSWCVRLTTRSRRCQKTCWARSAQRCPAQVGLHWRRWMIHAWLRLVLDVLTLSSNRLRGICIKGTVHDAISCNVCSLVGIALPGM